MVSGERPIQRLAYGPDEAAAAIGVSRETFDKLVLPDVKCIRLGRRILISVRELERYLERNQKELL